MAPTAPTPCRSSLGLLIPGPRSTTTPAGAICCAVGSLLGKERYECLDDGSRNGHARLRKISGNCRGAGRMAPRLSFCTPQRSSHGGARQPARPLPKTTSATGWRLPFTSLVQSLFREARRCACSSRQRRISVWLPDSSTAGTSSPSQTAGLVYCGGPKTPSREKDSPTRLS